MHDLKETQTVFLCRRGFHPCDQETYLKLKELHKLFWKAQAVAGTWMRWERKHPKNRFYWDNQHGSKEGLKKVRSNRPIPEPLMCPLWDFVSIWGNSAQLYSNGLCEEYRNARTPQKNRTDVTPLKWSLEQIDVMLAEARQWYQQYKEAA